MGDNSKKYRLSYPELLGKTICSALNILQHKITVKASVRVAVMLYLVRKFSITSFTLDDRTCTAAAADDDDENEVEEPSASSGCLSFVTDTSASGSLGSVSCRSTAICEPPREITSITTYTPYSSQPITFTRVPCGIKGWFLPSCRGTKSGRLGETDADDDRDDDEDEDDAIDDDDSAADLVHGMIDLVLELTWYKLMWLKPAAS